MKNQEYLKGYELRDGIWITNFVNLRNDWISITTGMFNEKIISAVFVGTCYDPEPSIFSLQIIKRKSTLILLN